jgi:hypothetical protein
MKLIDYLEALVVGNMVIKRFIEPTLNGKKVFWVPLRGKYTKEIQPKKMTAAHQFGINSLDKLLSAQGKRISISTFTSTSNVDKLNDTGITLGGRGLIAILEGTPLLRSHKDIGSTTERERDGAKENIGRGDRWVDLGNFGGKSVVPIRDEALKKIRDYLGDKDLNSLTPAESNKFISFYYKTVWSILKEKNPNNPDYYTHLSFGALKEFLISKTLAFSGNKYNSMSYNEVIMNKIKIIKIYYDPKLSDEIDKYKTESNPPFIKFDEKKVNQDLLDIRNQILGK